MDLVGDVAAQLKLEPYTAAGLAGALLQLVEDLVLERVDYAAAGRMRNALPEVADWRGAAPTVVPGTLSLSTLTAAPQGDESEWSSILIRFGATPEQRPATVKLVRVREFLRGRLDDALLEQVTRAVPMLASNS
jgi:hypothetical protein